jgi:hypothetical protein
MKMLQKILVMFAMFVGMTVTASAQKDDKRPPKEKPPVVNPQPKPPPTPEPKKPKPGAAQAVWKNEAGESA